MARVCLFSSNLEFCIYPELPTGWGRWMDRWMATQKRKRKDRPSDAAVKGQLSPRQSLGSFVFIF